MLKAFFKRDFITEIIKRKEDIYEYQCERRTHTRKKSYKGISELVVLLHSIRCLRSVAVCRYE